MIPTGFHGMFHFRIFVKMDRHSQGLETAGRGILQDDTGLGDTSLTMSVQYFLTASTHSARRAVLVNKVL